MYSRNCGSNCPRSCALIARSTRGSALIGPGPIRSLGAGLISSSMGMVLQPVTSDVDAAGEPHLLAAHVFQELLERFQAAGPADQPAVQAHGHHARHSVALVVEHVKGVLEIRKEMVSAIEALRGGKAHVVRIERVGHDELRLSVAGVVP